LRIFLNWVAFQDETDEIKIPSAYKKFKVKSPGMETQLDCQLINFSSSIRIDCRKVSGKESRGMKLARKKIIGA
jgi:hypothetical protein